MPEKIKRVRRPIQVTAKTAYVPRKDEPDVQELTLEEVEIMFWDGETRVVLTVDDAERHIQAAIDREIAKLNRKKIPAMVITSITWSNFPIGTKFPEFKS